MKIFLVMMLFLSSLFAGTPAENALELNMSIEDYEFSMAIGGVVLGAFFNFVLWRFIP
jgi:hypothetical protein